MRRLAQELLGQAGSRVTIVVLRDYHGGAQSACFNVKLCYMPLALPSLSFPAAHAFVQRSAMPACARSIELRYWFCCAYSRGPQRAGGSLQSTLATWVPVAQHQGHYSHADLGNRHTSREDGPTQDACESFNTPGEK